MGKKKPSKGADRPARARRTEPVYTVLTFITFAALAAGCTLLYLDYEEYGKQTPAKETIPALPKLGDAPAASATTAPKTDGM